MLDEQTRSEDRAFQRRQVLQQQIKLIRNQRIAFKTRFRTLKKIKDIRALLNLAADELLKDELRKLAEDRYKTLAKLD